MITENDLEFLQTVWNRRPFFTYVFFGINVLIFISMTLAGGTTNDATLLAFGVKANFLIDQGQYWRFVTPVFIHIGVLHLFFNSYALWIVGPQVERLYGGARFVLLYVLTGVAGVLGSYLYRPDGLSAGASGAIFGLFGVLLVFGIRHRHNIPPFFRRAVGTGVLPVIAINLFIGFTIPGIDNSAHIAGLLAGMALAAVIPFDRPRTRTPMIFTVLQYVILAIVAVSWFFAYQNVRHSSGSSSSSSFIKTMNDAQEAFTGSTEALNGNRKGELAALIKDVGKAIDELKTIPSLSRKSGELTSQLLALMQNQYELLHVDRSGTTTLMHDRQAAQNSKKYRELADAFQEWVNSEGEHYGIQLRKPR